MVKNKKGQTLIMFIILLPIFIGIIAFVVDYGIIVYEKNKLNNLILLSKSRDKKIEILLNDNNIKNFKIKKYDNCYDVTYHKDSLFGSILGIKEYIIKSSSC